MAAPPESPLYVDLDGTLYPGDTLWDSVALALQRSPANAIRLAFALISGRLHAKAWLASKVIPDVSLLPFREDLVALCRHERQQGRRVVLATAAHHRIAEAVAHHLGCFDAVIASDVVNRKGAAKREAIRADSGDKPFLYAGDSAPDRHVWCGSNGAIAAGQAAFWAEPRVGAPVVARFPNQHGRLSALFRALRPHQWVKNILVFVPLLASHRILDPVALMAGGAMFVAFCLCASSVYLLNDLIDLENDRAHARKKSRPLAAATLPIPWAIVLIPTLLVTAVGVAACTNVGAVAWLGLYYITTVAYSVKIKKRVLVDVFVLASLYALRCMAGHTAASIPFSPWLLGFMTYLFLSLAFAKRHSELFHLRAAGGRLVRGRGYRADDLELISMFGVAAGFMAALVMGLYVTSDAVTHLYGCPMLLWFLCPVVLYWITRVWLVAHRGELDDDPIVFALKDRRSYAVAAIAAAMLVAATFIQGGPSK